MSTEPENLAALRQIAGDNGALLVVDDAQWCDELSLRRMEELLSLAQPGDLRLLLGVGGRVPREHTRQLERTMADPDAVLMTLRSLSEAAVEQLTREFFGKSEHIGFVAEVLRVTAGIPFLVFSLFTELGAEGLASSDEDCHRLDTITSDRVARSVLRRLDGLPPEAPMVLEAVALSGRSIAADVVASATGIDPARVSRVADELHALDLLAHGRPLCLEQPLVRSTVASGVAPARAAELHLEIARSLKGRGALPLDVAAHLEAAEPQGAEWLVDELVAAAIEAEERGSHERSLKLLRRALAEPPAPRRRAEVLLRLAQAETSVDPSSALEHLRLALDDGAAPELTVEVATAMARAIDDPYLRWQLGSCLDRVAKMLPDSDRTRRMGLVVARGLLDRSPTAPTVAGRILSDLVRARGFPPSVEEREALAFIATVRCNSPGHAARSEITDMLRSALAGAQLVSEDPLACELWARGVLSLARTGEFAEADRIADDSRLVARASRIGQAEAEFALTLAQSLALQGLTVEAEAELNTAFQAIGDRPWSRLSDALACRMGVLLDQGRTEEAEKVTVDTDPTAVAVPPASGPGLLEQRGRLRAMQSRRGEALVDLFLAGGRADDCGIDNPAVTIWRREAALALNAEGRETEARALAEENLARARLFGANWVIGTALHTLALVSRREKRQPLLQESLELLEGSGARLATAAVLLDLGCALREDEAPLTTVREVLRRAADLAFRSRATSLISRAATELRLSGARPRQLVISGPGSLTASERRVVALAVQGLTNAAIASSLFLSEKTVEGHLARAFRKLGVRSRRELADVTGSAIGLLAAEAPLPNHLISKSRDNLVRVEGAYGEEQGAS